MADAPEILKNEKLRDSYPKLNAAIRNSNEALSTANTAKTKADTALSNSENTQIQLDTIVINGDSSVEAAQARVDVDGNTFTTLKERLDSSDAQLAETVKQEAVLSNTYTEPIELVLNDFSGYNQPYHPSVMYFPNGFAGYKYWMAQTPYPVGATPYRDRWECPVIYKSQDGITWITVADPLDDLTSAEIANGDYFSDPHLVYREDTGVLEVWYRLTKASLSGLPTNIIRKTTADGVTWSAREELVPDKASTATDFMRSPAIIWDNTNKIYRAWYQNNHGLYYNTSADGKTWGTQQKLKRDITHSTWHLDVNLYNGVYHLLSYSSSEQNLVHYTSDDGLYFTKDRTLLSSSDGVPLYSLGLYRSVSIKDENNKVRVYFSATNSQNQTRIGLIIADDFSSIQPIKRIDGERVLLANGERLSEKIADLGEQPVKVFAMDTFNGQSPYSDFPRGAISQNVISTSNTAGLPNGVGGLLITDWTSHKSLNLPGSENLIFQTFKERGTLAGKSGSVYVRSTQKDSPFSWGDWRRIDNVSSDYAVIYNSTNQSAATAVDNTLSFNTLTSADGTVDFVALETGKIKFIRAGNYMLVVKVVFDSNATGIRRVTIGSSNSRANALTEGQTIIETTVFVKVNSGDFVNIVVAQTSGASVNVLGGNSNQTSVRVKKL